VCVCVCVCSVPTQRGVVIHHLRP